MSTEPRLDEPETADLFRLRKVPVDAMPFTRTEWWMRLGSTPFLIYAPLMVAMLEIQYFAPEIRLGIESVWNAPLRTLALIVAVLPTFIVGSLRTRQEIKEQLAPTLYAKEFTLAAALGVVLGGLVGWSLGAPLTVPFGIMAAIIVFLWMIVTGIVAAFIAGTIRLSLLKRRLARAEELGIEAPFEMSARLW